MIRFAVVGGVLLFSSIARAEPRPALEEKRAAFGAAGQVAILGDTSIGISSTTYATDASSFTANASPDVLYFPVRRLAVGIRGTAAYEDLHFYNLRSELTDYRATSLLVGPTVGYDIPLSRSFSIFPRMAFELGSRYARQSEEVPPYSIDYGVTTHASTFDLQGRLDVPLVFHPMQHVLVGFGPYVVHDFAERTTGLDLGEGTTSVGASLFVGGYFGGAVDPDASTATSPGRYVSHLADDKTVVFTNVLAAGGEYIHSVRGPRSGGSLGAKAAADYFVGYHVSLGGAVFASHASQSGTDADTHTAMLTKTTIVGIEPRAGYALRFADRFAFWPRVGVAFGYEYDELASDDVYETDSTMRITFTAFAPLDVELTSHFFAGIGPFLERDLTSSTTQTLETYVPHPERSIENRSTRLGAGLELGAWL